MASSAVKNSCPVRKPRIDCTCCMWRTMTPAVWLSKYSIGSDSSLPKVRRASRMSITLVACSSRVWRMKPKPASNSSTPTMATVSTTRVE